MIASTQQTCGRLFYARHRAWCWDQEQEEDQVLAFQGSRSTQEDDKPGEAWRAEGHLAGRAGRGQFSLRGGMRGAGRLDGVLKLCSVCRAGGGAGGKGICVEGAV